MIMKLTTKLVSVVAVLALGLAGGVDADDTGELLFLLLVLCFCSPFA